MNNPIRIQTEIPNVKPIMYNDVVSLCLLNLRKINVIFLNITIFYSVLNDFTGLLTAALIACVLMVINAIMIAIIAATKNIHH